MKLHSGDIKRRPAQRFFHSGDLGWRWRDSYSVTHTRHTFELVGLQLRIEIGAVVQIDRHGVDIAAWPRRQRQPRQRAKALLHARHDVKERPAVGHAARPPPRRQRVAPSGAEDAGPFAAPLGVRGGGGAFGKRRGFIGASGRAAIASASNRFGAQDRFLPWLTTNRFAPDGTMEGDVIGGSAALARAAGVLRWPT